MGDEQVVQNEQAPAAPPPEAAQTQPSGEAVQPVESGAAPQPAQPLSEAQIRALIDSKAAEIAAKAVEKGKREMQSIKDAEMRRMQRDYERKLRLANSTAESLQSTVRGYSPEQGGDIQTAAELAKLRAESEFHRSYEEEERQRQSQEQYAQQLATSLKATLKQFGIAEDDKRIDWGDGATDYLAGRSRFDASVAAILAEKQKTEASNLEKSLKATLQAEILKMRKDAGLESVDTGHATGSVGKGRKPTLEEIRATPADEVDKKVKSGEWNVPGWV